MIRYSSKESGAQKQAIAGFLIAGILLRVWRFWKPDLWLDEYGSWWVAQGSWQGFIPRAFMGTGPLYHFFLKFFLAVFGENAFALRLPSVLAGLGSLLLIYPLAFSVFREPIAALYSLAVFSVYQPLIWHCQEARPYGLGLFFVILSFYCYRKLHEIKSARWSIGYVLSTAGAFYAHYLFGIILLIQALDAALKPSRRPRPFWLKLFSVTTLLCLMSAPHIARLFQDRMALTFLPKQGWGALSGVLGQLFEARICALIGAAMFLIMLLGRSKASFRNSFADWRLLILWIAVPVLSFFFVPRFMGIALLADTKTIHAVRYLVPVMPAVLMVSGWFLSQVKANSALSRFPLYLYLALTLGLCLAPAYRQSGTFGTWPDEGYAKAAKQLMAGIEEGDLVLFSPGYAEADMAASPGPRQGLREAYLLWPLAAHAPKTVLSQVKLVPFRDNQQTSAFLESLSRQAAAYRRVWCVGQGSALEGLSEKLVQQTRLRLWRENSYGAVKVSLLKQLT